MPQHGGGQGVPAPDPLLCTHWGTRKAPGNTKPPVQPPSESFPPFQSETERLKIPCGRGLPFSLQPQCCSHWATAGSLCPSASSVPGAPPRSSGQVSHARLAAAHVSS